MNRLRLFSVSTVLITTFSALTYYTSPPPPKISAVGDAAQLKKRYDTWKAQIDANELQNQYSLSLTSPYSHSSDSNIAGRVDFDYSANKLSLAVSNITDETALELWVTNGVRIFAEARRDTDLRRAGQILVVNGSGTFEAKLSEVIEGGFAVDQVIVVRSGSDPLQQPLLVGSLNLFQRLYAAEQNAISSRPPGGSGMLSVAHAAEPTGFPDVFSDLVTQGEDIFFNEAFAGNGRSCGTCHPATNNFTIDPAFIASLPADDPLFVGETVPALIFGDPANLDGNGKPRRFENPSLMRAFGLIVENADGMGDLEKRFTMRSVPHNIGMSVSIATPPNDLRPPDERTGWGGDGSPVGLVGGIATSGRLRDFIVGAVVQHYPKTLNRSFTGPNPDFRAPTVTELDALEAFMLSIGRQTELELQAGAPGELVLKDTNAETGKVLFRDGVSGGNRTCNGCHGNAGANVVGGANPGNRNFNTGVELFLRNRLTDPNVTVVGEPRPVDGGFGTNPAGDFTSLQAQTGFTNENFGNGRFNTTSLVEAADSAPFFHNNVISDLDETIRFYSTTEFQTANGGIIPLNDTQVSQIEKFLRVINAIDNVEHAALRAADRALFALQVDPSPDDVIHRILQIALAETQDAMDVLNQGGLHNVGGLPVNAVKQLERAMLRFQQAMNTAASNVARLEHVNNAKTHLASALTLMRF